LQGLDHVGLVPPRAFRQLGALRRGSLRRACRGVRLPQGCGRRRGRRRDTPPVGGKEKECTTNHLPHPELPASNHSKTPFECLVRTALDPYTRTRIASPRLHAFFGADRPTQSVVLVSAGHLKYSPRMRGVVFHGPYDVRVETVPDPGLRDARAALVRLTRA